MRSLLSTGGQICHGALGASTYFALSCFIKRDLRRAALFLWITPFLAARSNSLTAARTASSALLAGTLVVVSAWRALVTCVFTIDLVLRLVARRFSSWRQRFSAAALLGM